LGIPITFILVYLAVSSIVVLIFEVSKNQEFASFFDSIWWAIITFSTTGYGDKVPVSIGGRAVAIVSIFFGVAVMSLLSGTFASFFVDRSTKARRGLMELRRIRDHIVICGWKDHMMNILLEMLRLNTDITSEDLVIISNIDAERIGELREEKALKGLRFVKGDYYSESTLNRANIRQARKVFVLADTLESGAVTEVDSKTVMTVMTLRSMAKEIYICAELLDKKYEHYLKQAMCDEIILIRDYDRLLLANASATSGISHVLHTLLDVERGGSKLTTARIPDRFVGKPYSDYRHYVETRGSALSLGILENTGSPNKIKMQALREAQKTSDVSRLVSNLTAVKMMEANRPLLLPAEGYTIQENSRGIVLEKTAANGGDDGNE
jgi:voltage-gated potassium channel